MWSHGWGDEVGGRTAEVGFDLRSWLFGIEWGETDGYGNGGFLLRLRLGPLWFTYMRLPVVAF